MLRRNGYYTSRKILLFKLSYTLDWGINWLYFVFDLLHCMAWDLDPMKIGELLNVVLERNWEGKMDRETNEEVLANIEKIRCF